MASNPLPKTLDPLFALAEDMADGLSAHETALGIKQNAEAVVRNALQSAQAAQAGFWTARNSKAARTAAQQVADSNAKAFLSATRGVLANYLGSTWSQAWEVTGFPNQSTAVPPTVAERQTLLSSLQIYLTAHPEHENAPLSVTAARAGELFAALSDARSAVNAALTDVGAQKAIRDREEAALRRRMRGLTDELTQLLEPDDPRWYAFGLNPPAAPDAPEIPDGLVLTPAEPGTLHADWADAPRANRYRVWKQVVGTDEDFVAALTVNDSDASLTDLPSGATVRVRVTAVNEAGESGGSEVGEAVVA
jgi:hypothetical protein